MTAWWFKAVRGVVVWQNETGTWRLRDGLSGEALEPPQRLVGPDEDPVRRGDGPSVLLSPDGARALLGWQHEWDALHDLLEPDGSTRSLETRIPGYFLNAAMLWLDSTRVLFQTVANAPIGGVPTYRESGWRGDLAVFDLRANTYRHVTRVRESSHFRVAGPYLDDVLVTEWDSTGVRAHWLYDIDTWQRRATSLPKGRAFASSSGVVVVLLNAQSDTTDAVLVTPGETKALGRVARDAEPVFTPTGKRGALHTATGVIVFEEKP